MSLEYQSIRDYDNSSHFLKPNPNISRCPLTIGGSLTKLRILKELNNLILRSPV